MSKILDTKNKTNITLKSAVRPSSISFASKVTKSPGKETSVDSGKSSRTSSGNSNTSDINNSINGPESSIELIVFGNSVVKQSKFTTSTNKLPNVTSRTIKMSESRYLTSERIEKTLVHRDSDTAVPDCQMMRKTRRNSLPGIVNRKFASDVNTIRQAKHVQVLKKSTRKIAGTDTETKSPDYMYRENLSLDLSRMSDFADSEDETLEWDKRFKQKSSKNQNQALFRRRRSVDKDKSTSSRSGLPKSISSTSKSMFTRRSSLQSFTPRGIAYTSANSPVLVRNDSQSRSDTQSTLRNSDLVYSSASPDYTSEPSTCDTSPCKLSPNTSSATSAVEKTKYNGSNKATVSSASQIPCFSPCSSSYTGWMEQSIESEFTCTRDNENDSMEANVSDDTPIKERGEWNSFWRNYNSSLDMFPKKFYDDCPTPFYDSQEQNISVDARNDVNNHKIAEEQNTDIDDNVEINNGIKCIYLSKNEAKEMIHCAHRLAEILTIALEKKPVDVKNKTYTAKSDRVPKNNDTTKYVGKYESNNRTCLPLVLEINENSNDKRLRNDGNNHIKKNGSSQTGSSVRTLRNDSKDVLL